MRGGRLVWFLAFLVLALALIYLIFNSARQTNWAPHFKPESKDPHGLYLFHKLLESNRRQAEVTVVKKKLTTYLENVDGPATYFYTGKQLRMTPSEAIALGDFVRAGNTAFLAVEETPLFLLMGLLEGQPRETFDYWSIEDYWLLPDSLIEYDNNLSEQKDFLDEFREYYRDSLTRAYDIKRTRYLMEAATLKHHKGQQVRLQLNDKYGPTSYEWSWLRNDFIQPPYAGAEVVSTLNDTLVNGISIPVGAGRVIWFATPLVLSNFNIKDEQALQFAESLLQDLSLKPQFIIDQVDRKGNFNPSGGDFGSTPLAYILNQPSLRWAWYILLTAMFLFLISASRRLQRIIPTRPVLANSAIAYAETLGALNFNANDPGLQTDLLLRLFKRRIKERLHISDTMDDQAFFKAIAKMHPKLKKTTEKAYALLYFKNTNPYDYNNYHLKQFYNHITLIQNAL
jgi:hypothetical protein